MWCCPTEASARGEELHAGMGHGCAVWFAVSLSVKRGNLRVNLVFCPCWKVAIYLACLCVPSFNAIQFFAWIFIGTVCPLNVNLLSYLLARILLLWILHCVFNKTWFCTYCYGCDDGNFFLKTHNLVWTEMQYHVFSHWDFTCLNDSECCCFQVQKRPKNSALNEFTSVYLRKNGEASSAVTGRSSPQLAAFL